MTKPPSDDVNALLIGHLRARAEHGARKYGVRLTTFNGRSPERDALEESLDLAVYLVQMAEERQRLAAELKRHASVLRVASDDPNVQHVSEQLDSWALVLTEDTVRIEPAR